MKTCYATEMQLEFFGHVMPLVLASVSYEANGAMNGRTSFFRSMTIKIRCNMTFLATDTTATSGGATRCQQCCQWHHCISVGQES